MKIIAAWLSVLLSTLAIPGTLEAAPAAAANIAGNLAAEVPAYLAPYVQQHDFSGAVFVSGPGGAVYQHAFGYADVGRGAPNSINTQFAVGSVSKSFTAAAIELLATQGKLHYGDSLARYVPEYRHAQEVTIEQLLGHNAGIPDFYALPAWAAVRTRALSLSEIATWLGDFPLDFSPGTNSRYSNSGYSLLALVVERVSHESYAAFLKKNIFVPLHLKQTSSGVSAAIASTAIGYDPAPAPQDVGPAAVISPGWLTGNGSIRSTGADLQRWLDVARAGIATNFKSLPYPYGWSKRTVEGSAVLGQEGRIPGFAADISIDEVSGLKIVVLSNIQCAAVSNIARDVRRAAHGVTLVAPQIRPVYRPSAAELAAEAGKYALPFLPLLVSKDGDGLGLSNTNDGMMLALDAISPGRFFFRPLYVYVSFKKDARGSVRSIDWDGQIEIPRASP